MYLFTYIPSYEKFDFLKLDSTGLEKSINAFYSSKIVDNLSQNIKYSFPTKSYRKNLK